MATGTLVFIPSNGASITQEGQGFPNSTSQPKETVQYIQFFQYGNQQHNNSSSPLQQNPRMGTLEKLLKKEGKTLGAIQIMNGLIHIGFGIVSTFLMGHGYRSLAVLGGYPFWGGLSFIFSGSVSAEKHLIPEMVNCMVGLNITSAIMASVGIILYVVEMALSYYPSYYDTPSDYMSHRYQRDNWSKFVGIGLSVMLLLFSLLEFCITVFVANFGYQASCCNNVMQAMVAVPWAVSSSDEAPMEGSPAASPPAYDAVDFLPSENEDPRREVMRSDSPAISARQLS